MSQPTFGNINDGSTSLATTVSVGLTVTTGNLLVVQVGTGIGGVDPATRGACAVSFASGANVLTRLTTYSASDSNFERVDLYYYLNPPAGALTVLVDFGTTNGGSPAQIGAGVFELIGVDLAALFGTPVVLNNDVTSLTLATAALVPTVNQLVLMSLATDDDTGGTPDNGFVSIWEELGVATDSAFEGASFVGTGASVTPQWSGILAGNGGAMAAVVVNGPTAAPAWIDPRDYGIGQINIQQRMG